MSRITYHRLSDSISLFLARYFDVMLSMNLSKLKNAVDLSPCVRRKKKRTLIAFASCNFGNRIFTIFNSLWVSLFVEIRTVRRKNQLKSMSQKNRREWWFPNDADINFGTHMRQRFKISVQYLDDRRGIFTSQIVVSSPWFLISLTVFDRKFPIFLISLTYDLLDFFPPGKFQSNTVSS